MRLPLKSLAAALLITVSAPAFADKVTDAIGAGLKYYEEQRLAKAIGELGYAVGQISRRLAEIYEATMPPAPGGWKTQKARRQGVRGGIFSTGVIINKRYRQLDGRGSITAQLIVDNPMMQAFAAMFVNPQVAAASGFERTRVRGVSEEALIKYDPDNKRGEARLMLASRVFIKLNGSGLESEEVLKEMLQGWNYAEIKRIAEIK